MSGIVYWAHLPEHTDILTQGYVGITTKSLDIRIDRHFREVSRGRTNAIFQKALRKYGDLVLWKVVAIAPIDLCMVFEKQLRPTPHLGWNTGPGGESPTVGYKHTATTKKILSEKARLRKPWTHPRSDQKVWSLALNYHEDFCLGKTSSEISIRDKYPHRTKLKSLWACFKSGWIPKNDNDYLLWLGSLNNSAENSENAA